MMGGKAISSDEKSYLEKYLAFKYLVFLWV